MIALDASSVLLAASPATKEQAIREVAALLTAAGHVDAAYAESMLGREQVANTYLGEGIAIPHGMLNDRDLVKSTGIAVLQVPSGLEWNPGEPVRLVVGIAATGDEHIAILANLTQVLADPAEVERLATTDDVSLIVDRLTRAPSVTPAHAAGPDLEGYASAEVVISGHAGLHARPATFFLDVASRYSSDVRVRRNGKVANGKSLASLLSLGADAGSTVTLLAKGADQDDALQALREAVEQGLGEEEEAPVEAVPAGPAWSPARPGVSVPGVAASPGIAIGPLWYFKRRRLVVERTARDPAVEERRLHGALESARAELRDLYASVKERSGAGKASIFRAHEAFLDDPDLVQDVVAATRAEGTSAGWAWRDVIEARAAELMALDDPLLRERGADLHDVGDRVLRFLAEADEQAPQLPDHPVVLIAEDLTPSDTATIDPARVVGFATSVGGPTSHTAIVARALGIPAIVGAGPAVLAQPEGATAVLDGTSGTLWLGLDEEDLASAAATRSELEDVRAEEHRTRYQPAILTDGYRVEVAANVQQPEEVAAAVDAGAEGIGLVRTEFLFLGRETPPTEQEQYEALEQMVRALNGLPLIVRTLDIGGDKNVPYIGMPHEDNPFLGVRGIRLCLARPDLFVPQLRAIYRASMLGPVRIMFPMVSGLEELEAALEHAEKVRADVGADPIDVGIMIEVPSAVLMAPELARRVQFFSIGTNDLTQYVLAVDRLHPALAKTADALHPAVLRMVKAVVDAADAAGIWVGVCGGAAGEPEGALLLAGLGVRELSVSVPAVAAVKALLRRVSRTSVQRLAERALRCSTAAEVRGLPLP